MNVGWNGLVERLSTLHAGISKRMQQTPGLIPRSSLLFVLALAFGIRLLGIRYGLPYAYHTDEPTVVERALRMLRTGDYNPHFFNYPTLTIYIQAIVYAFYFLVRVTEQTAHILHIRDMPNHFFYLPGRLATALIGVATVWLVYSLSERMWGKTKGAKIGLMSALFLSIMPIHVTQSRWITPNVPAGFFTLLSFYFAYRVFEKGKWYDYLLGGLTAGLAASAKYNGVIILVALLVAHILSPRRNHLYLLGGMAATALGFLIGTPYAVLDPAQFLYGFRAEQVHYKFRGHGDFWWYARYLYFGGAGRLVTLFAIVGLIVGFWEDWRKHIVVNAFFVSYFVVMSSYLGKAPRNLVPMLPFLALNAAWGVEGLSRMLEVGFRRWGMISRFQLISTGVLLLIAVAAPFRSSVQEGIIRTRKDTVTLTGEWVATSLPQGSTICVGYERLAPRYVPPIPEEKFVTLPVTYEQLTEVSSSFWCLCDYIVVNEQVFTPLSKWRLLQRFDPAALQHPGRRIGVYDISATGCSITDETLMDFERPEALESLAWVAKPEGVNVSIANSTLSVSFPNHLDARDTVIFRLPVNVNIQSAIALLLRVRLARGSFLTLETIVDGKYTRPLHLNYYQGTGEWVTLVVPLPSGQSLDALNISLSEPDEIPIAPNYSFAIDWLKVRQIADESEAQEVVFEEFDDVQAWVPYERNNVDCRFEAENGLAILGYRNDPEQRDICAYRSLHSPISGVESLRFRVRIHPGTFFTVDVVKNGALVSPRFLNYYPGTGEWEEVVIPVGGRLDSLTIGIGEMGEPGDTPDYRLELDWIKAVVRQ